MLILASGIAFLATAKLAEQTATLDSSSARALGTPPGVSAPNAASAAEPTATTTAASAFAVTITPDGRYLFGAPAPFSPHIELDPRSGAYTISARNLVLEESNDPPDLTMRRQQGVYPDGARVAVGDGVSLSNIRWQAWGSDGNWHTVAQLLARTKGASSATNEGAEWQLIAGVEGEVGLRPVLAAQGNKLGFLGVDPVAQQPVDTGMDVPTQVKQVIAALRAYGLLQPNDSGGQQR